jgi:hypothetical protein
MARRNEVGSRLRSMRPLELVKAIILAGARLQKRRVEEGTLSGLSTLDASRRAIEAATAIARRMRAGPLPQAKGLERIALAVAAGQLRAMASLIGVDTAVEGRLAGASDEMDTPRLEGFVSPGDRALARNEGETRVRAALGVLVAETLALVDAALATSPELEEGASGGHPGHELGSNVRREPTLSSGLPATSRGKYRAGGGSRSRG